MRNFRHLALVLMVLVTVTSCEEDEPKDTLTKETISAKWVVTGSSNYESFEFNESSNYIIAENSAAKAAVGQIVHYGVYQIINNETINLVDFGTIKVTSLEEENFNFTLTLDNDPNNNINIEASKQADIASSSRTDLLCRTWEMVTIDGESVAGTEMELNVLFSSAGTYFVEYFSPGSEGDGGLAQWQWKDEDEEWICYSWEGAPTCTGNNEVELTELTSTSLTIIEFEEVYVLQPVSNKKAVDVSTMDLSECEMRNGLFLK